MSTHPFDAALTLKSLGTNQFGGHTRPEWANMVGPFGGITAATLLRAVEEHPDRHGDPLALTINYLAPVADGEFEISARAPRTNRTNQHWILELSQDGEPKATASAVFGVRRQTWSDTETAAPAVPEPESLPANTESPPVVWAANYDMRFVTGGVPGADAEPNPSSTSTLWVRDARERRIDFAALTALSDVFFPRVFLRRGQFVPAGTISMTVYFHADTEQLTAQGSDFVLATATANRFAAGHFDQAAQLFSRGGELLASTHQLVYYKG